MWIASLIRISEGTVNRLECCGRTVFVKIVAVERRMHNDTFLLN